MAALKSFGRTPRRGTGTGEASTCASGPPLAHPLISSDDRVSPQVDSLEAELVALRRNNEQLRQLAEQAIRMGEKLLVPARGTVIAYRQYVRLAAKAVEAAEPASRHLAAAVDKLSRLVGDARAPVEDHLEGIAPSAAQESRQRGSQST